MCLSVILIDSVFRVGKNYYPSMFPQERKYIVKEKQMPDDITDKREISSDDCDTENFGEKILMRKFQMKKIKYEMCLVLIFEELPVILG